MIKPTIGRKIWYWPTGKHAGGQPHDATIVYVWNDRMVNLACHDENGKHYAATSVTLLQEDDAEPGWAFAEWMPYQTGQAKAA
jgi:hypothetical protein